MSWAIIDKLDANDADVRRRIRDEQAATVTLLADLLSHLYQGLEARGQHGATTELERWGSLFLGHAVSSMRCALNLLLDGYYGQALGMLRYALEDASVVAYLSHQPDEAAALTAASAISDANPDAAKVSTGRYRQVLQKLGDDALAAAMGKIKEFVEALHQYAHPSLFAVTLADTDEGIATGGYYSPDAVKQAAYMFISVYLFVQPAVVSYVGASAPAWRAEGTELTRRCAAWIAPVNRERGLPEPPLAEIGGV